MVVSALLTGACSGVVVVLVTLIFATVLYVKVRRISKNSKKEMKAFLSANPTQFQGTMHFACSDCESCKKKMDNIILSLGRQMSINPTTLLENAAGISLDFASKTVSRQVKAHEAVSNNVTEVYATPKAVNVPESEYSKFTTEDKQDVYDQPKKEALLTKPDDNPEYGVLKPSNTDSLYDRVG